MKLSHIAENLIAYEIIGEPITIAPSRWHTNRQSRKPFGQRNLHILAAEKTKRILSAKLQNLSHPLVIIIALDVNNDLTERYVSEIEKRYPDAIRIIISDGSGTGDTTNLMTPWMILHNVGHALTDQASSRYPELALGVKFWRILEQLSNDYLSTMPDHKDSFGRDLHWKQLIPKLVKSKSARDGTLQPGDFGSELFAYYLWHGGRITLNKLDGFEDLIDELEREATIQIDAILSAAAGHTKWHDQTSL
tara:strand:- start:1370 stop:2116 length:747 start_codon:yes stop_codon:yes gene_type:complete